MMTFLIDFCNHYVGFPCHSLSIKVLGDGGVYEIPINYTLARWFNYKKFGKINHHQEVKSNNKINTGRVDMIHCSVLTA